MKTPKPKAETPVLRYLRLWLCACLCLSQLVACSDKKPTPTQVQPSSGISREDTAKLLNGVADQLDALKDALAKASPKPATSADPAPVASATPGPTDSPLPTVSPGASAVPSADPGLHPCLQPGKDSDADSLSDSCEDLLAQTYAPVIYHSSAEDQFPTNVDKFLTQTVLWFGDSACDYKVRLQTAPSQLQLTTQKQGATCGNPQNAFSNGTRSKEKKRGYYLEDLPEDARVGSKDAKDWITYVHVYRNKLNGATVQYWRLYAYHDAGSDHGGDWDGVHIMLDSQFRPVRIGLLTTDSINYVAWKDVQAEGSPDKTHPRIFIEANTHLGHNAPGDVKAKGCKGIGGLISCHLDPENTATFVRQETWKNGQVSWFSGETGTSGGLINVGEKLAPLNGQAFIQYAGLWGSPGSKYASSGFWGPAYDDRGLGSDGYINAWAANMLNPLHDEAYALAVGP